MFPKPQLWFLILVSAIPYFGLLAALILIFSAYGPDEDIAAKSGTSVEDDIAAKSGTSVVNDILDKFVPVILVWICFPTIAIVIIGVALLMREQRRRIWER